VYRLTDGLHRLTDDCTEQAFAAKLNNAIRVGSMSAGVSFVDTSAPLRDVKGGVCEAVLDDDGGHAHHWVRMNQAQMLLNHIASMRDGAPRPSSAVHVV